MNIPGFTGEASLYKSIKHYAMSTEGIIARDGAAVIPQYCGPCINGRRQCGDYQWDCGYVCDPTCIFGPEICCQYVCTQGSFHTWSIPCRPLFPRPSLPITTA
jgi:hypothetical protein